MIDLIGQAVSLKIASLMPLAREIGGDSWELHLKIDHPTYSSKEQGKHLVVRGKTKNAMRADLTLILIRHVIYENFPIAISLFHETVKALTGVANFKTNQKSRVMKIARMAAANAFLEFLDSKCERFVYHDPELKDSQGEDLYIAISRNGDIEILDKSGEKILCRGCAPGIGIPEDSAILRKAIIEQKQANRKTIPALKMLNSWGHIQDRLLRGQRDLMKKAKESGEFSDGVLIKYQDLLANTHVLVVVMFQENKMQNVGVACHKMFSRSRNGKDITRWVCYARNGEVSGLLKTRKDCLNWKPKNPLPPEYDIYKEFIG